MRPPVHCPRLVAAVAKDDILGVAPADFWRFLGRLKMLSRSLLLTPQVCALLFLIAGALLSGPAGFGPCEPSAEATSLNEIKKLLVSDAGNFFG